MNMNNECRVFEYCDNVSHEDMSSCCNSMDRYYGAVVGGVDCLFCAKCEFLSHGTLRNSIFYRDHGVHLGQQSRPEKMMGIMKGNVYFYILSMYYLYILQPKLKT